MAVLTTIIIGNEKFTPLLSRKIRIHSSMADATLSARRSIDVRMLSIIYTSFFCMGSSVFAIFYPFFFSVSIPVQTMFFCMGIVVYPSCVTNGLTVCVIINTMLRKFFFMSLFRFMWRSIPLTISTSVYSQSLTVYSAICSLVRTFLFRIFIGHDGSRSSSEHQWGGRLGDDDSSPVLQHGAALAGFSILSKYIMAPLHNLARKEL